MRLNKTLFIIGIPVMLSAGCNISRIPNGNYCIPKNIGPDYITVSFSDKSYKAKSWSDVAGEFIVEGSWNKMGDTIFLNPFKPRLVDTIIKTSAAAGEDLVIKLIDKEKKKPLENAIIRQNEQEYVSNEYGIVKIPKINSGALLFSYYTISDTIDNSMLSGNVEIYLNFERLKSIQLPDKWLLKGKRLIPVQKNYTALKKC